VVAPRKKVMSVPTVTTFGLDRCACSPLQLQLTHCVQRCRPMLPLMLVCTGGITVQGRRRGGAKRQRLDEIETDETNVFTADVETESTGRWQQ
jgi:hypothetical protein